MTGRHPQSVGLYPGVLFADSLQGHSGHDGDEGRAGRLSFFHNKPGILSSSCKKNCFVENEEIDLMELDWAGLPLEVETIAESLSASGYRTAMTGGPSYHIY